MRSNNQKTNEYKRRYEALLVTLGKLEEPSFISRHTKEEYKQIIKEIHWKYHCEWKGYDALASTDKQKEITDAAIKYIETHQKKCIRLVYNQFNFKEV